MQYGIAVLPGPESWRAVQRAEELGFSHAWFYDTQMLGSDVFMSMTQAAMATSKIVLGTGVLIPTNRIAPVAASAFGTLNAIAPGRVVFGVGTGFTGRNTMGQKAMPQRAMQEYIRVVRGLLGGETVSWRAEGKEQLIRFMHPGMGFINQDVAVPVHVSAFGPRGVRYAVEHAEGWMTFAGSVGPAVVQVNAVQATSKEIGRESSSLYKTVFALGCVLAEGEEADGARGMAQAGPQAAVGWHGAMERWDSLPEPVKANMARERALYESYDPRAPYLELHRGHLVFVRDDERPFISADLIRQRTYTGTQTELRDRVRAIEAAGYDQFCLQLVHGQEDAVEDWARVFDLV